MKERIVEVVPLKEALEQIRKLERDYVDARFDAVEDATNRARESMEKRLEGMNEFRDTLKNQAATFLTREEQSLAREEQNMVNHRQNEDIKLLTESKNRLEGKASQTAVYIAALIGIAGLLTSIATALVMWVRD